ncbi:MAG: type IV secretory system conjugative DNA transfer family protein [Rhodobacteraceae bacterium]|nr:type IV secretory system conjugative DNA transfer family protein [Paracoccaceae bacterium]
MPDPSENDFYRYGSARFVDEAELEEAAYFTRTPTSIFIGFFRGRPLWWSGQAGICFTAGARAGKFRDVLAYTLCAGIHEGGHLVMLDPKAEGGYVSQNQTPDGKHCRFWNPLGLLGLPQDRLNPLSYLIWSSPSLFSDMKVTAEGLLMSSGSSNAVYFEHNARRYLEAIGIILTKLNKRLTFPDLYNATLALVRGDQTWLDLAYEMHCSGIPFVASVEEEIAAAREDSSGGFKGIVGEIQKAFSCLSDPVLLDSVSPPFDFDLADFCRETPLIQFYIQCPAELIAPWAPVIKSIFTGAMIHKSRKPSAPGQTWMLDECGQLGIEGGFDLVPRMFTYGAGIGIRPVAVFQHEAQMNALGKDARNIIKSSAGLQISFGIRDLESAQVTSKTIGRETLHYDRPVSQRQAHLRARQILGSVLGGADPFRVARELEEQAYETNFREQLGRDVRTPDELLNAPANRMLIRGDGLTGPAWVERLAYYTVPWMAGLFHPNPSYPPYDRVEVQTRFGPRLYRVVVEPVPEIYAHLPQYRHGLWSRLEGPL